MRRVAEALARIRRLYAIERQAKNLIDEAELTGDDADAVRRRLRQEQTVSELTDICQWLGQELLKVLDL